MKKLTKLLCITMILTLLLGTVCVSASTNDKHNKSYFCFEVDGLEVQFGKTTIGEIMDKRGFDTVYEVKITKDVNGEEYINWLGKELNPDKKLKKKTYKTYRRSNIAVYLKNEWNDILFVKIENKGKALKDCKITAIATTVVPVRKAKDTKYKRVEDAYTSTISLFYDRYQSPLTISGRQYFSTDTPTTIAVDLAIMLTGKSKPEKDIDYRVLGNELLIPVKEEPAYFTEFTREEVLNILIEDNMFVGTREDLDKLNIFDTEKDDWMLFLYEEKDGIGKRLVVGKVKGGLIK